MLDLTKVPLNEYGHVQTREGLPVKLLTKTRAHDWPIVGLVAQADGLEIVGSWMADGAPWIPAEGGQLVPVPQKVRVNGWLNVYDSRMPIVHATRKDADKAASSNRVACVQIDIELTKGHGL